MRELRGTIVRLLSNMGSAKEIQLYLKRFSKLDAARFAVVKVGGAILRDEIDALVSSLSFLQQVGLTPIVLHGAGPQLDDELRAAGIEKQTVDGLRVTSPEALVERLEQTLDTRVLVVPSLMEAMCNEGDSLALFLLLVGRGWRVISSARGVPQGGGYDGWLDEFPTSASVVSAARPPTLRLV